MLTTLRRKPTQQRSTREASTRRRQRPCASRQQPRFAVSIWCFVLHPRPKSAVESSAWKLRQRRNNSSSRPNNRRNSNNKDEVAAAAITEETTPAIMAATAEVVVAVVGTTPSAEIFKSS